MRTFHVYKRDERSGMVRQVGIIQADDHVRADTKARMLYGHKAWTRERVAA